MIIKSCTDCHDDPEFLRHARQRRSAMQMGKLADFVGGQGQKGGKRWRLVFTAGSVARCYWTLHCMAMYMPGSEAL